MIKKFHRNASYTCIDALYINYKTWTCNSLFGYLSNFTNFGEVLVFEPNCKRDDDCKGIFRFVLKCRLNIDSHAYT